MSKDIVLSVRNLCTSFINENKKLNIVKNVSFELKRASTLAIVGESGCGKSLTVNSIVKLVPKNAIVTADSLIYTQKNGEKTRNFDLNTLKPFGKEMRNLRGQDIGMIFQDPMTSLNPVYRVGDQVAEGLLEHNRNIKKSEARNIVIEMFKELGIPDPENRINDFPYQFSGGMKQRVIIAMAMICNPEIVIADEPTTALDVTIQAQIMDYMKKLQVEKKKSIILITHNMGLVAEMADEICVMYMGRVVEFGKLEDIFNNPSHPYTKALLRSVPVLGLDDEALLETIPGMTPNPADLKDGCDFAERCPNCTKQCIKGSIPIFEISPGHKVRCIKFNSYKEVD